MRTRERNISHFSGIRMTRIYRQFIEFLIFFYYIIDMVDIKLRIYSLREHIKRNRNHIRISCSFSVSEECSLNSVRSGKNSQLCRSNSCTSVIMRMKAYNKIFTIIKMLAHILYLVRIYVRSCDLYSFGKIYYDLLFRSRL